LTFVWISVLELYKPTRKP